MPAGIELWISGVLHTGNNNAQALEELIRTVVGETGCGRFYFSPVRNFTGALQPFLLSYAQIAACQSALVDVSDRVAGVERVILDHPYEAVWRDYFWPLLDCRDSRLRSLTVDGFGNILEQLGPHAYRKLDVFPHGPWGTCRIDARGEYLADVEARTYALPTSVGNIADFEPGLLRQRAMADHLEPMLRRFLANMEATKLDCSDQIALTSVSIPVQPPARHVHSAVATY